MDAQKEKLIDLLKSNNAILKCMLQELRIWADKDVKNHYEKDKKLCEILEAQEKRIKELEDLRNAPGSYQV